MKKMLLHAAVIFTLLAGSTALYAQMGQGQGGGQWGHGQGQPPTAEQRLQRMTQQLNLSEAQQQQIKPILENEAKQMQALRGDSSLSQDDRMAKMTQIRQDSASQIKPILNADQQKQYDEMMSRQGHGRGPGGPGQMRAAYAAVVWRRQTAGTRQRRPASESPALGGFLPADGRS